MIRARVYPQQGHFDRGAHPWISLVVHDDLADLRAAARRLRPGNDFADTGGVFQPTVARTRYDKDGTWEVGGNGLVGTMRLAVENVSTEIVAHECAHAALEVYRRYWRDDFTVPPVGNDERAEVDDEEEFCYILGSLVAEVSSVLRQTKVWQ